MRCETCGARNVEGAAWCTQCYTPFAAEAGDAPPSATEALDGPAVDLELDLPLTERPDVGDADPDQPRTATPVEVGDVRDIDGVVEWRCSTCASWNALEQPSCAVCGAFRSGFGEPARTEVDVTDLDPDRLFLATLALPGLGHLLAGWIGTGITRMVLALLWLLGGVWWLVATATGRTPGVILVLGALAVWVTSAVDVRALLAGRDEPFGVRGLLWLVVGVTGLLMLVVALVATGPSLG